MRISEAQEIMARGPRDKASVYEKIIEREKRRRGKRFATKKYRLYTYRKTKELRKFNADFIDYDAYLASREWQLVRNKTLKRCNNLCEACKKAKATQVHHITYRNLGSEKPWQLLGICWDCHKEIHGTEVNDD